MTTLIDQLDEDTDRLSSPDDIRESGPYKALLAKGEAAIGDLIQALKDDEAAIPATMLLRDITGMTMKTPPGDIAKLAQAWINWAKGRV